MLAYLTDKFRTWRLRAKYERLVQERVLALAESSTPRAVADDPGHWLALGESKGAGDLDRADLRTTARRLAANNPHARNVLRLLEVYVVGPGLRLNHTARSAEDADLASDADRLWTDFLRANRPHFSFAEYARRAWRDGETFLRVFPAGVARAARQPVDVDSRTAFTSGRATTATPEWLPSVRFVDPETIGPTPGHPDSHGIVTDPDDVESPLAYLRIDPATGRLVESIPAEEMLHTRVGVDSNVKRGTSIFEPIARELECFEQWRDVELQARKLQASIVLWRKVQGGPAQVTGVADDAETTSPVPSPYDTTRRERYRGGTILTTSAGTELEFLQPDTNFGDAVPLGRMLLLCAAAGAGLPEFMLTSDASNANYASTMVAEGPAVKRFQAEQRFFADEFERLWRMVVTEAIRSSVLPADTFDRLDPSWTFPQLVTRDRPKERLADARLVAAGVLSRAEVARRDGVDPAVMRDERGDEGSNA